MTLQNADGVILCSQKDYTVSENELNPNYTAEKSWPKITVIISKDKKSNLRGVKVKWQLEGVHVYLRPWRLILSSWKCIISFCG